MRLFLLAAGVLALGTGTASAQEATYDWSGLYVGAQIGHAWGDAKVDYLNPVVFASSHEPDGYLGGFYLGYNHNLSNNLVLGVDADIAWSRADSGFKPLLPSLTDFGAVDTGYSAALRARAGFAAGRLLPYVAGGLAVSRAKFSYDMISQDAVISDTMVGWTLGAGMDYAATDNLILRAEYRYSDFGDGRKNAFSAFPKHQAHYTLKTQDFRLGLAYKF